MLLGHRLYSPLISLPSTPPYHCKGGGGVVTKKGLFNLPSLSCPMP